MQQTGLLYVSLAIKVTDGAIQQTRLTLCAFSSQGH